MFSRDSRISKRQLVLLLSDLLILVLCPLLVVFIYLSIRFPGLLSTFQVSLHPTMLVNIGLFVLMLYFFNLYDFRQDFRRWANILRLAGAVTLGAIGAVFLHYFLNIPMLSRSTFILYCAALFFGFLLVRVLYSWLGAVGVYDHKTLIVGAGESGQQLLRIIQESKAAGLKVIGFLDLKAEKAGRYIGGVPVYHQEGSLADSVTALRPRVLIVAMKRGRFYELAEDLTWCAQQGIEIWDVPTAFEHLEKRIPLPYVDEIWLLNSAINWPRVTTYRIKRLMDLFLASFGILITSPIMIAISAAIRIESRGPSILLQQRIGKHGRVFDLYKFRSMYQSRPMEGDKGTNDVLDRRITRVGRVIRPLHLDELPQLFNVLLGDLSLVGPRAELYDFICDYVGRRSHFISHWQDKKKPPPSCETTGEPDLVRSAEMAPFIPYIEQRFTVDQGITGWAQVMHPYVTSSYEDMVRKLEYDLYYIKNMSTLLDLIIIFMTVRLILTGKGK